MGPIKQLGHQRRRVLQRRPRPTPSRTRPALTNLLSIWLLLSIPFALTYTFGKMVGQHPPRRRPAGRHGASSSGSGWASPATPSTSTTRPSRQPACTRPSGTPEGKEVALRRHDQRPVQRVDDPDLRRCRRQRHRLVQPDGRLRPDDRHDARARSPRAGPGAGSTPSSSTPIIAVFIGGLMIGRTPEYLGKKIQAREVKLAGLGALVMPIIVLVLTAIAVSHPRRAGRPAQRRSPRVQRDPLRPHLAGQQQRLGLGRPDRQHRLLQHHRRHRHADRPVRDHDPGPGPRRARWRPRTWCPRRSGPSAPTTACSSA